MIHRVKTWPLYFMMAIKGAKPFEIRKNDRNYKIGDTFVSQEFDVEKQEYTGMEMSGSICNVSDFKQRDGFVVLGIIWDIADLEAERDELKQINVDLNKQIKSMRRCENCNHYECGSRA